jgi:hypothetical protein
MDLGYRTRTFLPSDLSWIHRLNGVFEAANSGTINLADPAVVKATHYPDGFIKQGVFLGLHTSGTYDTYFAPYVADEAPDTGLTVVAAVVLSGFPVNYDEDGTLATTTTSGSILLASAAALQLYVSKLPGLLNDAGGARPVVPADLPSGWIDIDTALGT